MYRPDFIQLKWLSALLLCFTFAAYGQVPFSTSGTEFAFAIPDPRTYYPTFTSSNYLVINSVYNATCTVSVSAIGYQQQVQVPAGEGREIKLPLFAEPQSLEIRHDTLVRVTSDFPVSVSFKKRILKAGGMMTVWPTAFLGREYQVCTYRDDDRNRGATLISITAICDSTPIEITPTDTSNTGSLLPGNTYQIVLRAGESFQFRNNNFFEQNRKSSELTGTLIRATGPPERKIAVSVAKFAYVSLNGIATGETMYEMMIPRKYADTLYYDVPMPWHVRYRYRVMAWENQTDVWLNNQLLTTLQAGQYHQFDDSTAIKIHSNKPIQVFRLIHTNPTGLNPNPYLCDPELTQLEPASQRVKKAVIYPQYRYFLSYSNPPNFKNGLQLICPKGHEADLTVNGVNKSATFKPFPADTGYVYSTLEVDTHFQLIESEKGFYGQFNLSISQGSEVAYLGGNSDYDDYFHTLDDSAITRYSCQFPYRLDLDSKADFYLWSNGSVSSSIQAQQPGTYWVTKALIGSCDTLYDTDTIILKNLNLDPIRLLDSALCKGDSIWFSGQGPFDTLIWEDQWTQTGRFLHPGVVYTYEIEQEGCRLKDSLKIEEFARPELDLPDEWPICNGQPSSSWTLTSQSGYQYSWSPANRFVDSSLAYPEVLSGPDFNAQLEIRSPGGCSATDTMRIINYHSDTAGMLRMEEIWACEGAQITLRINPNTAMDSVLWEINGESYTGSSWTSSSVNESTLSGKAIVHYEGACKDTLSFNYEVSGNDGSWDLANVFTPNGDGINDEFHPINNPEVRSCAEFEIYNRWGQLVFSSDDGQETWDGTINGVRATDGTYFCVLHLGEQVWTTSLTLSH